MTALTTTPVRARTCRACGDYLETILHLGNLHPSAFPAIGEAPHLAAPLDCCRCKRCRLVQLRHTVDPDLMFKDQYWYRSSINEVMRAELADIVAGAIARVPAFTTKDLVVDIGANDGTLLAAYRTHPPVHGVTRIAFEPARNLQAALAPHAEVRIPDYFPQGLGQLHLQGRCKVISSIACVYDLDDPGAFAAAIADCLTPDGVWVVQFQDLAAMIHATAFDNLCFPAGERIITPQGLRPIEDLVEGDCVLTHRGRYRGVANRFVRHYEGDLMELTAYGFGHTLRVTPNHPVYTRRAGGWAWVPAEQIVHGDIVARPILQGEIELADLPCSVGDGRRTPTLQMIPLADLVTLFGYYLAEGSIATNGDVLFYFGPNETDLVEDCRSRIERLGFAARIDESATSLYVQAHGPISRVLQAQCGRGAAAKHLSPLLLSLPRDLSEELLRAYVKGDGYEYRENYLRASTVSEQLALDIAMLANRVGWKASINEQDRPATCVIEGRTVAQLSLWDILIHTDPQLKQKVWLEDGYQCGRVRRIERVPYSGPVYNIEVLDDGTYVSPAMTVHNCHEHLCYYSLHSFEAVIAPYGLEVVDAEVRAINGGSYRLWVQKAGGPLTTRAGGLSRLLTVRQRELGCDDWETLERFAWRVGEARRQIQAAVEAELTAGGVVDAYGASTKFNTLLQYCGLGPDVIRQAIERSPEKWGRATATGIPIVSEAAGRADPATAWLVGIWQFREAILQREAGYLAQGGRLIFPLPVVDVITQRRAVSA